LGPGQQWLLRLRAGLDGQPGLSRASVARILHVSPGREHRLERTALADLSAQAQSGCPATAVTESLGTLSGSQRAEMVGWITPVAGPGGAATSATPTTESHRGSLSAGGVTRGTAKTRSNGTPDPGLSKEAAVNVPPVSGSDPLLAIILGVLAFGALALSLLAVQDRRLRSAINRGNHSRPLPAPEARQTRLGNASAAVVSLVGRLVAHGRRAGKD
jgi:hypothetical protein